MACAKVISDFEVLSAGDAGRRRDWTDEEKIRIVEESLLDHRQGSATARRVAVDLVASGGRRTGSRVMARPTYLFTIGHVATLIGENLELLEQIAMNSDNIDYGEMIDIYDGSDESRTAFTERSIESLQESLAEVRTWQGGIRAFLENEGCDPATIDRIMADQPKP